jgi:hypothetical protein
MIDQEKIKKIRVRSPNYPAFPLEEAINKAHILWDKDGKVGAHRTVVYKHLGYISESGASLRTVSALKIYGLISDKKEHINLTEKALNVILYPVNDAIHKEALIELALKPKIFRDLYEQYGGSFPSDTALKAELIQKYNFNPHSVNDFINTFRDTMEYAGVTMRDSEISKDERIRENNKISTNLHQPSPIPPVTHGSEGQSFPIPFMGGNKVTLTFDRLPISKKEIDKLKGWIDLFEDTLTVGENIIEE